MSKKIASVLIAILLLFILLGAFAVWPFATTVFMNILLLLAIIYALSASIYYLFFE